MARNLHVNTTQSVSALSEKEMAALTRHTGDALRGERKVWVTIPYAEGSGERAVECGINGYNYVIRRGTAVELPQSVCDVLRTAGIL